MTLLATTLGHSRCFSALLLSALLAGCAADPTASPLDPFESTNRRIFQFNEKVDENLVRPVAVGYKNNIPQPIQTGVTNFFANLNDIWSTVNNALQAKPKETVETGLRAAINTVIGVLGLFDVASHAGLERHNADFGQTLGVWGVPSGPYVVLPLLGPSSARDTVGWTFDNYFNLWNTVEPMDLRYGGTALKVVDYRTRYLGIDDSLNEIALDKYSFMRDAYLQRRSADAWRRYRPADLQNSDGDGDDGADGYEDTQTNQEQASAVAPTLAPPASVEEAAQEAPEVLTGPTVIHQPDNHADTQAMPALENSE